MAGISSDLVHPVGMLLYQFQQIFLPLSDTQSILPDRAPCNDNGIAHCSVLFNHVICFIIDQFIIAVETKIEFFHDSAVQVHDIDAAKTELMKIVDNQHRSHIKVDRIRCVGIDHNDHCRRLFVIPFFPQKQSMLFII